MQKQYQLILTMAGKYNRFKLFGNKIPKYLLPLSNETILGKLLSQYIKEARDAEIYLIANKDDQIFYPIVRAIISKHNISSSNLMYIDDTASQLETALTAVEIVGTEGINKPVAFTNIDTILLNRQRFFETLANLPDNHGIVDTFNAANKDYSYVRLDEVNNVVDIIDKNIISNAACSGLYGFGSLSYMSRLGADLLRKNGEANFTDLYATYVESGLAVYAHRNEDPNDTTVLGTPEEYLINIHKFK